MMARTLRVRDKKATKRIVKFLALWPESKVRKLVVKQSPDSVIKAISNAALNARQGEVSLRPAQRRVLRKHQKQIAELVSPKVPLARKRRILQSGNGLLSALPLLLSAVLSTIGPLFLNRDK